MAPVSKALDKLQTLCWIITLCISLQHTFGITKHSCESSFYCRYVAPFCHNIVKRISSRTSDQWFYHLSRYLDHISSSHTQLVSTHTSPFPPSCRFFPQYNSYRVLHSMHASYEELCQFLHYLKPRRVVPCVVPVGDTSLADVRARSVMLVWLVFVAYFLPKSCSCQSLVDVLVVAIALVVSTTLSLQGGIDSASM